MLQKDVGLRVVQRCDQSLASRFNGRSRVNRNHHPIFIAGAGCAGLSLAVHLLRADVKTRIILADSRQGYVRDRTWCGFATRRHPFAECVDHQWHHWRVRTEQHEAVSGSHQYPYEQIPADRFYRAALSEIEASHNAELRLGTRVERIEPAEDRVRIHLSDGTRLSASGVFDSRPLPSTSFAGTANDITLYQQFVGLHVVVPFDVFEPGVVEMMDFRLPQEAAIQFVYVLPYSRREAMVEATAFAPRPIEFNRLERTLLDYLQRHWSVVNPDVLHREQGVIPMTTIRMPVRPHARVIRIGLAGAAAKPSTGYAFGAIQGASAELTAPLARGVSFDALATPRHRRRISTFLDDVFLSYLHRHPSKAPNLFRTIFDRCPGDVISRFLTDTGDRRDDLRMIGSMPKLPFMIEAFRSVRTWCQLTEQEPCPPFRRQLPLASTRLLRQGCFMPD